MGSLTILVCLLAVLANVEGLGKLCRKYAWKFMDYDLSPEERRQAIHNGNYIPENNLPVGIEVVGDRLFISVPRWSPGVPSTLNWIPLNKDEESPLLIPYPNLEFNREGNCAGITTTYRIRADKCGRLWVLDSGTLGIGNTTQQLCPYALHAIDLKTNRPILRYQFKDSDTNADTFIANIAVDVGNDCSDTYVYASDELGYGLIVYSLQLNDSWRFEHGYFRPDPLQGDFNIAGLNFQWDSEGIFGMALSPTCQNERYLLFHPLASHTEFAVPLRILRNKTAIDNSYHEFHVLGERGDNTHSTSETMTEDGILVYTLIDQNGIGCWNSDLPFNKRSQGIIAKDDEELIFPSDVRLVDDTLYVISDRMAPYLISSLDYNDTNFRVFYGSFKELISGTICEKYSLSSPKPLIPPRLPKLPNLPNLQNFPIPQSFPLPRKFNRATAR